MDEAPATIEDFLAKGLVCETATISSRGRTETGSYPKGTSILEAARRFGLHPPSSCLSGNCATCIASLTEGSVEMWNNEVLTPKDLADGYILTCQSVPTSKTVTVVYED